MSTVSVYWEDDWKSLTLEPDEWAEVQAGKKFFKAGKGYCYEGTCFHDFWCFNHEYHGSLLVGYDDGGQGFIGELSDAEIEHHSPDIPSRPKARATPEDFKLQS